MHFNMEICDLLTIALLMRYHEAIFLKFLKLALLGTLSALIRACKDPNFKIMHFNMRSCDLLTIALLMRYHEPIFLKIFEIGPFRDPICPNKSLRAGPNFKIMHFKMESCDLLTIALQMRYHKPIFLKFLKLALSGTLFALIRAYKGPNFKIMHFKMENCDLLTIVLLMRNHKPIFMKFLKLALFGILSALIRARLGPKMQIFKK